jgi:hypothetical protein
MTQENGIVPARQQAALVFTYLRQLGFKHRASRSNGFQVISKPLLNTQYTRMGDAMSQLDAYTMQLRPAVHAVSVQQQYIHRGGPDCRLQPGQ